MSKARFTKGPWHVHNNDVYLEIVSEGGEIANTCMSGHIFDDSDCVNGVTTVANSHLIAASPAMYKDIQEEIERLERLAKKYVISSYELQGIQSRIQRKRELLAKARGE